MKKEYKDLYAGFIIAIVTAVITPLVIKLWQVTLYQNIDNEIVEEVQEFYEEDDRKVGKEVLYQSDIDDMNRKTELIAVKSLEIEHENNPYYFLRNNDGSLYIVEDDRMKHEENYIIEVDTRTDEIVKIHWDLEFEFDKVDEEIFTEWFNDDIETGREMLNEYLGIENYTEVSI